MAVRIVMSTMNLFYRARDVSQCVHVWDAACLHFPKQHLVIYCVVLPLWQFKLCMYMDLNLYLLNLLFIDL